MAFSSFCGEEEETWEIWLCDCEDAQSEHVHCGCNDCNGKAVSRSTAFRHRTREFHISAYSSSDAMTSFNSFEEGSVLTLESQQQNVMDTETSSGEHQYVVDQVMFDDSDSFSNVLDSNTCEERELSDLNEDEPDSTKELTEKIVDAILDALQLQLELKLSNIGFDHILDWGKKLFAIGFSKHVHL